MPKLGQNFGVNSNFKIKKVKMTKANISRWVRIKKIKSFLCFKLLSVEVSEGHTPVCHPEETWIDKQLKCASPFQLQLGSVASDISYNQNPVWEAKKEPVSWINASTWNEMYQHEMDTHPIYTGVKKMFIFS